MSYKHPEYVRGSGRNRWYYIPELDEWCHYTIMRRRLAKLDMSLSDYYDKYLMMDASEKFVNIVASLQHLYQFVQDIVKLVNLKIV